MSLFIPQEKKTIAKAAPLYWIRLRITALMYNYRRRKYVNKNSWRTRKGSTRNQLNICTMSIKRENSITNLKAALWNIVHYCLAFLQCACRHVTWILMTKELHSSHTSLNAMQSVREAEMCSLEAQITIWLWWSLGSAVIRTDFLYRNNMTM